MTTPALRRGLGILELLAEQDDGLRIPEITRRLNLPRASTHELVRTLGDLGYVTVSSSTGLVTLGSSVMRLSAGYQRALDLASVGRECARKVATKCGETVQVVVRDGPWAVYIVRIDSKHSVRLVSQVGSRLPATCTAGGKMMLSQLSTAELDLVVPNDASLSRMTARSIRTRKKLDEDLARTSERGWAWEYCESNTDVSCVAAPVFNQFKECVAALSISVPVLRWRDEDRPHYVKWAQQGAAAMSRLLGNPVGASASGGAGTSVRAVTAR